MSPILVTVILNNVMTKRLTRTMSTRRSRRSQGPRSIRCIRVCRWQPLPNIVSSAAVRRRPSRARQTPLSRRPTSRSVPRTCQKPSMPTLKKRISVTKTCLQKSPEMKPTELQLRKVITTVSHPPAIRLLPCQRITSPRAVQKAATPVATMVVIGRRRKCQDVTCSLHDWPWISANISRSPWTRTA